MPSTRLCIVFAVILFVSIAPVSGDSASGYEITLDQPADVPTRTIEYSSAEYTVSSVGRYAEEGVVDVSTSGPQDTSYAVRLVDSQERLRDSAYVEGDGDVSFPIDRYSPGTYAVVITNESDADDVKAVNPLVIYGYTVAHSTPKETESDSALTVEFSLDRVSSQVETPPENVEIVLGNDSTKITKDATRTSDLTYTAEVDVSPLSTGDYQLYTGVQRDNTVYGYNELIGVSTYSVSIVESESTATATPTASPTDAPHGGSGSTATATPTEEPAPSTETTQSSRTTSSTSTVTSTANATSDSSADTTSEPAASVDDTANETQTTTTPSPPTSVVTSSPTSDASNTPVNTPAIPDGGLFVLCAVVAGLLSRIR